MTTFEQSEFNHENDSSISKRNLISNWKITKKQMQTLSTVLTAAVDTKVNRLNNEFRQLLQFTSQQSSQF